MQEEYRGHWIVITIEGNGPPWRLTCQIDDRKARPGESMAPTEAIALAEALQMAKGEVDRLEQFKG